MNIKPLIPLRPDPVHVQEIVSQPFDVIETREARERLKEDRISFLHVLRSEIDFPEGTNPTSDPVLNRARENLERMVREGLYLLDDRPSFFLYCLNRDNHEQIGVALRLSVRDYLEERVRRHERVRPSRVYPKALHIDRVGACTGPVFLAYPSAGREGFIQDLRNEIAFTEPLYDVPMPNGIRHRIYRAVNPDLVEKIQATFASLSFLYIADGHHRAASAVQACEMRRQRGDLPGRDNDFEHFLAVCFPANQLRILPIHRVLQNLGGRTPAEFLKVLRENFPVEQLEKPETCRQVIAGTINLLIQGGAYRVDLKGNGSEDSDPVASLDVSLLHDRILSPFLGITDPTTSENIRFCGGWKGADEAVEAVASGNSAAAFFLHPVDPETVIRVADAGRILPPKTTWFDPKMRSGFLLSPLDDSYRDLLRCR